MLANEFPKSENVSFEPSLANVFHCLFQVRRQLYLTSDLSFLKSELSPLFQECLDWNIGCIVYPHDVLVLSVESFKRYPAQKISGRQMVIWSTKCSMVQAFIHRMRVQFKLRGQRYECYTLSPSVSKPYFCIQGQGQALSDFIYQQQIPVKGWHRKGLQVVKRWLKLRIGCPSFWVIRT